MKINKKLFFSTIIASLFATMPSAFAAIFSGGYQQDGNMTSGFAITIGILVIGIPILNEILLKKSAFKSDSAFGKITRFTVIGVCAMLFLGSMGSGLLGIDLGFLSSFAEEIILLPVILVVGGILHRKIKKKKVDKHSSADVEDQLKSAADKEGGKEKRIDLKELDTEKKFVDKLKELKKEASEGKIDKIVDKMADSLIKEEEDIQKLINITKYLEEAQENLPKDEADLWKAEKRIWKQILKLTDKEIKEAIKVEKIEEDKIEKIEKAMKEAGYGLKKDTAASLKIKIDKAKKTIEEVKGVESYLHILKHLERKMRRAEKKATRKEATEAEKEEKKEEKKAEKIEGSKGPEVPLLTGGTEKSETEKSETEEEKKLKSDAEILEIKPDAKKSEITTAYRKASLKTHPDRNPDDPKAAKKFKRATEAYDRMMAASA